MFEGIYEAIHREMDALEEKYASGAALSGTELETIDKMAHALKCLATYEAMKSAEKYDRYPRRKPERYSEREMDPYWNRR